MKPNRRLAWLVGLTMLLFPIAAGATGCGPAETPGVTRLPASAPLPDGYIEYTDTGFGFRISFPANWDTVGVARSSVEKSRESIPKLQAGESISPLSALSVCPQSLAPGTSYAFPWLTVIIRNIPSGVFSVTTAADMHIGELRASQNGYEEFSRQNISLDGTDTVLLEYRSTTGTFDTHALRLIGLHNGYYWEVQAISYSDRYGDWKEDFSTILQSFSFLD